MNTSSNSLLPPVVSRQNICPFEQSCHSVAEAAAVVGTDPEHFVKNICMTDAQDRVIVAIVKGEDRASTSRVAKALQTERVRTMTPDEMLVKTGYPCGGTPSFGFAATFLVDPRVMEKSEVYTGGRVSNFSCPRLTPRAITGEQGQGCADTKIIAREGRWTQCN